jgi:hypothetical protein
MTDDDLQRRLASNEALFRKVNEGIERGQWPGEAGQPIGFRCECARLGCNLLLELTSTEYEHVRAEPNRFVMIGGHELMKVETVIKRAPGYVIVEKLDEAGEHAQATDPRS